MMFDQILDHLRVIVVEMLAHSEPIVIDDGIHTFAGLDAGIDERLSQLVDVPFGAAVPYCGCPANRTGRISSWSVV